MHYLIVLIICAFTLSSTLYADSLIMKDNTKLKGLVIEEYSDRVLLSTIDGEKNIFRKDIYRIEYDTPEQNFMQLGRAYDEKKWYDKAAFYYKKAMEINPDYKEAREAYLASHTKMWRQEERMTRKELDHRNMVMDWWKNRNNKESPFKTKDKPLLLNNMLGISLVEKDGVFTIDSIRSYSSADRSGIEEGDMLVGIWGRLIQHSKIEDVIDELIGPKHSEIRVLIEKKIPVAVSADEKDLYKELGVMLGFEYEGLAVKDIVSGKKGEVVGFKKGDFVTAIDSHITRYLPLDSIIALINSSKENKDIVFTIKRTLNLRREAEK